MTWPYLVRFDAADHDEGEALDTLANRAAASNLNHLARSHGQVLVNWAVADGRGVQQSVSPGESPLWKSGAFPMKLRPDGAGFSCRIRLRARRVGGSGAVAFRARMGDGDFATFTTSSTTSAWLTPTNGFGTNPNVIAISPEWASWHVSNIAAPSALGDSTVAFPESLSFLSILAQVNAAVGTSTVELTGLHITEYYGA